MRLISWFIYTCAFLAISCDNGSPDSPVIRLVDRHATDETRNLYSNLLELAPEAVMFGHQATLWYGVHWRDEPGRSDVKDVTGSYPAVYGWDVAGLLPARSGIAVDEQRARLLAWSREGYERGGILTYCWHKWNPVTGQSFYDTTRAVHAIIPGGTLHEEYKATLDTVADFFNELSPIPVIFRPFHEHNGDWFWWGKGLATEEDFIALWRFTVRYLRDEKNVHNLIYAFSPDRSRMKIDNFREDYMYGYPGDDYVDIIGLDNYWDLGHPANDTPADERFEYFVRSLTYTVEIAREKNKLAALTETGLEAIPDSVWWTDVMLAGLLANEKTRQISYLQVWRNANRETDRPDHYYAPYPGQISAENFIRFREHPFVLFEDDLPDMYSR
jgi:mannan endo-1,4-beta-mannosidase